MRLLALRCYIETEKAEGLLSALVKSDLSFSKPRREKNGFSFLTNLQSKKALLEWARRVGCTISVSYEGALTPIFALRERLGIIFGIILSLFLIYLSTFYVWSVRIEGNEELDDAEIIKLLSDCGFREGVRKNTIDVNEIQNVALQRCHELSFLSINIHGMVADVVVHERRTSSKESAPSQPYNLVADCDGVIVSSLVVDGQSLFQIGDTVSKGQLLVSGLIDSTSGKTLLTHSRGKVYAKTNRTLSFEIPFESVEKIYTHTVASRGVRILGHSFHKNNKNPSGFYELELEQKDVALFGLSLPLTEEVRYYNYYVEEKQLISPELALERAYEEYRLFISTELDSATVTSESFSTEKTDTSIILTAEVSATENIAIEKKINITE